MAQEFGSPQPPIEKKSNTGIIIAIIVVILLCCCCVGGGAAYWLWNNGDALLREFGTQLVLLA